MNSLNILQKLTVTTGKISYDWDREGGRTSLPGHIRNLFTTAMIGVILTQIVFGDKDVIDVD
jgi:hypothetical protein